MTSLPNSTPFKLAIHDQVRGLEYSDTLFYKSTYAVSTSSPTPVRALWIDNGTARVIGTETYTPPQGVNGTTGMVINLWSPQQNSLVPVIQATPLVCNVPSLGLSDWTMKPSSESLEIQYRGVTKFRIDAID